MTKKQETVHEEVTYTRLGTSLQCGLLEEYSYRVNGTGLVSTAPHIPFLEGGMCHYALSHWYKSQRMLRENLLKRSKRIIDEAKDASGGLEPEVDDKLSVALAAMTGAVLAYKVHYRSDFDKWEILHNEVPFEFELGDVLFRGKIDLIVRDKETDTIIVIEHKSATQVSKDEYSLLPMDLQDLIYTIGATTLLDGELPDFRMRNYIIKTKLRRRGKGTEDFASFEARVQAQYVEEPEGKFLRTPPIKVETKVVENVKKQLLIAIEHFYWVAEKGMMNFKSCKGMFGKACIFGPACIARLQGHKTGWDAPQCRGLYRLKEHQHLELDGKKDD